MRTMLGAKLVQHARYAGAAAGRCWYLLQGDARDLLQLIPPGGVDLVVTDPPYHLSKGGTTNSGGKRAPVDKGAWDRGQGGLEAEHQWHRTWLRLVQRACAPEGSIWVCAGHDSVFSIGYAMQSIGMRVLNIITWTKPAPPPNLGCRQLTHTSEYVIWAAPREYDPLLHFFDYKAMKAEAGGVQMRDLWSFGPPKRFEKRFGKHPTQKPEALTDRIMRATAPPGCTVLDPFVGSGTTAVSALRYGCDFVGFDLSADYLKMTDGRALETRPA